MSTALALVDPGDEDEPKIEVVGPGPTLEELAATANREYQAGIDVAGRALQHWFAAGEALMEARMMVPPGEWLRWVSANFNGQRSRAQTLIRFATYRQQIEAEGLKEIDNVSVYLRGLPDANSRGRPKDDARAAEGVRLRKAGLTFREIGDLLGVAPGTVMRWQDPERYRLIARERMARSRARQRAVRDAEKQKKRDAAVRKEGGPLADTYSFIRRGLQSADKAHEQAKDRERRACISAAIAKMHGAEDEIIRALGVS